MVPVLPGVMQVIGTLEVGGAERMAVNLANKLPRDQFSVHLCSTRAEGSLDKEILPDVRRLALTRKSRLSDIRTVFELATYVRRNNIRIIHCHQYTIFLCALAALLCRNVSIIWHDHYGPVERSRFLYRIGARRAKAVIAVSQQLAEWAIQVLGIVHGRVSVIPNFVIERRLGSLPQLPYTKGCRLVCVANLHPVKDIVGLVRAVELVLRKEPDTQLLIAGESKDPEYAAAIQNIVSELGIEESVILLGRREDIPEILAQCDIGCLNSTAEGLPLALLEYGMSGLASISTRVGQCAEVLDDGRLGLLVTPGDTDELAASILRLVKSPEERLRLGKLFQAATRSRYSEASAIPAVTRIYQSVLGIVTTNGFKSSLMPKNRCGRNK